MRCNIALLPKTLSKSFIELSAAFSTNADYLLGEHSYPHITLAQFYIADNVDIDELWQDVKKTLAALSIAELDIHFNQAYSKVENAYAWLELRFAGHPLCYRLHEALVFLLEQKRLFCINASLDKYLPHLTLARTTDLFMQAQLPRNVDMKDTFYVALGEADELGQFVQLLKR